MGDAGNRTALSHVPRRADHTMVQAVTRPGHQTGVVPQEALGWPFHSGRDICRSDHDAVLPSTSGRRSTRASSRTIRRRSPAGPRIPIFVSKVDRDGNEVAGVRLPPVEAPDRHHDRVGAASRRLRGKRRLRSQRPAHRLQDHQGRADGGGQCRPCRSGALTNHEGYVAAVTRAAQKLEKQRLLLPADVRQYIERAQASDVFEETDVGATARRLTPADCLLLRTRTERLSSLQAPQRFARTTAQRSPRAHPLPSAGPGPGASR